MDSNCSLTIRWLSPLKGGARLLFLFWTAWSAVVWTWNLGDDQLERAVGNTDLRLTLQWLIHIGDVVWIILAAINIHGSIAESEGLDTARRWALIVCGGSAAVAIVSVFSGWPLGPIRFGTDLGMKLGPVPLGVPLLWFVLVMGARSVALWALPGGGHRWVAVATGALVLLADFNLEPSAARLRGFWSWLADPPSQPPVFDPPVRGYVAWFVFGALFGWVMREKRVSANPGMRSWKPLIVFGLLNGVFLLGRVGQVERKAAEAREMAAPRKR